MKTKSSTDERYPLKNNSSVGKKTLKKLNKKYGPVNKNFVKGESNSSRTNESVNIGHFSDKKLKEKLDAIETMPVETKKKRNNRNGKIGVKKHNNYTPKASAPKKLEVNVIVLIIYLHIVKLWLLLLFPKPMSMPSVSNMHMPAMDMMRGLLPQNPYAHPSIPYMFHPYFNAFQYVSISFKHACYEKSMCSSNDKCAYCPEQI